MTALIPEPVAITLTADEYAQLPPSSRMELVDGALTVGEPPTLRHQDVVYQLRRVLEAVCPRELRIVWEQEMRLGELLRRNPDLMAVRAASCDLDGCSFLPRDIALAVEVESPTSRTRDRLHKPAEYAEAGIPHFWRVETTPELAVHTYQLSETGGYLETGVWKMPDTVNAPGLPWATVDVSLLDPGAH